MLQALPPFFNSFLLPCNFVNANEGISVEYVQLLLHWGRQEQVDKLCDFCLRRRTLHKKLTISFVAYIHLWREGEERWMWGEG